MSSVRRNACCVAVFAAISLSPASCVFGREAVDQAAIEAGRRAIQKSARFPWYDRDRDTLREVRLPSSSAPLQPNNWQWQPRKRTTWSSGWWEVIRWTVWISLIGLFAFLTYLALRMVVRKTVQADVGEDPYDDRTEADRIEDLPFPVTRSIRDLLSEARHNYENGNLSEAIVYLYSYELVQLDKADLIRLAKGKTNRQYLGELRSMPELRRLLTNTVSAFEDVFFGRYELSRDRFERCWNELEPFHLLVRGAPATL